MPDTDDNATAADRRWRADIGAQQVARVYAEAFLNVAQKLAALDELVGELAALVATIDKNQAFRSFLASGAIGRAVKAELLDKILTGRVSPMLANFLHVLNNHGRLDLLRAVVRECHELRDRRLGRLRVQVHTAVDLDVETQERIRNRLRRQLVAEPVLETTVDPELLGGLVIRVGDMVYDGSVRTRLERLRQQIRSRSLYEIQGRRDHGGYSEGN